jgi:hypothetical protein
MTQERKTDNKIEENEAMRAHFVNKIGLTESEVDTWLEFWQISQLTREDTVSEESMEAYLQRCRDFNENPEFKSAKAKIKEATEKLESENWLISRLNKKEK